MKARLVTLSYGTVGLIKQRLGQITQGTFLVQVANGNYSLTKKITSIPFNWCDRRSAVALIVESLDYRVQIRLVQCAFEWDSIAEFAFHEGDTFALYGNGQMLIKQHLGFYWRVIRLSQTSATPEFLERGMGVAAPEED